MFLNLHFCRVLQIHCQKLVHLLRSRDKKLRKQQTKTTLPDHSRFYRLWNQFHKTLADISFIIDKMIAVPCLIHQVPHHKEQKDLLAFLTLPIIVSALIS